MTNANVKRMTAKSKRFHLSLKYAEKPKEMSFRNISTVKIPMKT